ncbi:hypothetical protein AAZX31_06G254500 [Glycine max]|uniref:Knottin scorpion toxin-like domain-containing protein n=1 Tax=Glycine max TaxID=3847 RepID=A0A0R0JS82_SOYBN|nr:hypothetical protein JHK87_016591 [Glycine soja]KAG5033089.1 hypothetical protein JHK85_017071 [Glycine max]KRH55682.1 hypothetical protein GLYMA_06G272100v4 [Glycine max]
MAKISFTIIFAFALIFTVISRASEATTTDDKCLKVLDQNNCDLTKCRANCNQQYHGTGHCIGRNPYKCICIYDCSP